MMRKKVLLLGAAGRVGTGFSEEYLKNKDYQESYELILGVHSKTFKDDNFKIRDVSLEDIKSLKKAMRGVSVVINLAANPSPAAEFKDLIKPNLIGAYNVFRAALDAECDRVIFASSVHAVGGYEKNYEIKSEDAPKPLDLYGATKAFGEALCYTFSSKYGLSCFAIRIGAYSADEKIRSVCFSRKDYEHAISQRDMGQLIHKSIIASKKIKYGVLNGVSRNRKKDMDLKTTTKLVGYEPQDDVYEVCEGLNK